MRPKAAPVAWSVAGKKVIETSRRSIHVQHLPSRALGPRRGWATGTAPVPSRALRLASVMLPRISWDPGRRRRQRDSASISSEPARGIAARLRRHVASSSDNRHRAGKRRCAHRHDPPPHRSVSKEQLPGRRMCAAFVALGDPFVPTTLRPLSVRCVAAPRCAGRAMALLPCVDPPAPSSQLAPPRTSGVHWASTWP